MFIDTRFECVTLNAVNRELRQQHRFSTAERDLEEFLEQEFDIQNHHPLALVNDWIEKKLIIWGDAHHRVIEDWIAQNERRAPLLEIQRFEKLAKRKYPKR